MVLFYTRQVADVLQALVVLVVRAAAVLMRRGSGASGRTGPGSNANRQKIGLLLVSLLLALQAAPSGSSTSKADDYGLSSKLEAAGSCGHRLLGALANCGSGAFTSIAENNRAPAQTQAQGVEQALPDSLRTEAQANAQPNCSAEHPEAGSVCWAAMWGGQ